MGGQPARGPARPLPLLGLRLGGAALSRLDARALLDPRRPGARDGRGARLPRDRAAVRSGADVHPADRRLDLPEPLLPRGAARLAARDLAGEPGMVRRRLAPIAAAATKPGARSSSREHGRRCVARPVPRAGRRRLRLRRARQGAERLAAPRAAARDLALRAHGAPAPRQALHRRGRPARDELVRLPLRHDDRRSGSRGRGRGRGLTPS